MLVNEAHAPTEPESRYRIERIVTTAVLLLALAPGVSAQNMSTGTARDSSMVWLVVLGLGLMAAMFFGTFWNRRFAHEKRELRRLEQRVADLTEGLPIGLFEYRVYPDDSVRLLFNNKATRDLFRLEAGVSILRLDDPAFTGFLHPDDRPRIQRVIKRSITSLEPINETFQYLQPDGHYRWMAAEVAVRVMDDGSVLWTGNVCDQTNKRAIEEAQRHLIASKELFFTAASQELRDPVQELSTAVDQLARDYPVSGSGSVQSAQLAARKLEALVDDFLELAKGRRDELTLEPEDFSLTGLLNSVLEQLKPEFTLKAIASHINLDPGVPVSLIGDHNGIHQALHNLLSNALRFSINGDITLSVNPVDSILDGPQSTESGLARHTFTDMAPVGTRNIFLEFVVTDRGEGISAEQIQRVFEPFVSNQAFNNDQALTDAHVNGSSEPRQASGAGLGLAICRQIIERMRGRIWLESVPGHGTIARFRLPLRTRLNQNLPSGLERTDVLPPPAAHSELESNRRIRKRRNILLVDDDRLSRTLMATLLSNEGYLVTEAGSGIEGLGKFSQGVFDAVVTDIRMPGMDGDVLAGRIRGLTGQPSTLAATPRLIALTASLGDEVGSDQIKEVFDKRLHKPVAVEELISALEA